MQPSLLPPRGTPVHGLPHAMGLMGEIARQASANAAVGVSGDVASITGSNGSQLSVGFQTQLRCFEVRSAWRNTNPTPRAGASEGNFWVCDAVPVTYYWGDGLNSHWGASHDGSSQIFLAGSTNTAGSSSGSAGDNPPPFGEGDWLWCVFDYQADVWRVIQISAGDATSYSSSSSSWSSSSSSATESSGSTSDSDSGSSSSSSSSTGTSKSSAIVPASWSPGGYTALFVDESPTVQFNDVFQVMLPQKRVTHIPVDARYLEVCEPGSVLVSGCVPDKPVLIGASMDGQNVRILFAEERPDETIMVTVQLTGIRKGFRGLRFPDRTQAQFEANERFIQAAYANA